MPTYCIKIYCSLNKKMSEHPLFQYWPHDNDTFNLMISYLEPQYITSYDIGRLNLVWHPIIDCDECFDGAVYEGNFNMIKMVIGCVSLHRLNMSTITACEKGDIEIVKLLIKNGANEFEDFTRAAENHDNYDIVDFLLEYRPELTKTTMRYWSNIILDKLNK